MNSSSSRFQFSFFPHARTSDPEGTPWLLSDVVQYIANESLRPLTEKIRKLRKDRDELAKGSEEYKQLDAELGNAKRQLPSATFAGIFERRNSKALISHSGFIAFDIDDVRPEPILEQVRSSPQIALAYTSPSGKGVRLIIQAHPLPTDAESHKAAWLQIRPQIEKLINMKVDLSGSDVSRLSFFAYDPHFYLNEDRIIPFAWNDELPRKPANVAPVRMSNGGGDHKHYVRVAFEDELLTLSGAAEGNRNHQLNKAAFSAGQFIGAGALDRGEAYELLYDQAIKIGLGHQEIVATIKSGINQGERQPRDLSGVGNGIEGARASFLPGDHLPTPTDDMPSQKPFEPPPAPGKRDTKLAMSLTEAELDKLFAISSAEPPESVSRAVRKACRNLGSRAWALAETTILALKASITDFAEDREVPNAETIIQRSWEIGEKRPSPTPMRATKIDMPEGEPHYETFPQQLQAIGVEYRYNVRTHRTQMRELPEGEWVSVTDRITADVRLRLADRQGDIERDWQLNLDGLLFHSEVDPFREWLESLPEWDGIARLDEWLREVFTTDPNCQLTPWVSRFLCLGPVWRTYKPGTKMDEMPVLMGAQGIGKSTAVAFLLPEKWHGEWFTDSLNLAGHDKERVESLQGRVIVESGELAGLQRAEIERLKSFLSRTDDGGVRLAWRRDPESTPRRCIIVGTTNALQPLPDDPSGNRRFVPIRLRVHKEGPGFIRKYLGANRNQLWAEALMRYQQGEVAHLTPDLKQVQTLRNEDVRSRDEITENAIVDALRGYPFLPSNRHKGMEEQVVFLDKLAEEIALAEYISHDPTISAKNTATRLTVPQRNNLKRILESLGFRHDRRRKHESGNPQHAMVRFRNL